METVDILIVGAGFAGLRALHTFRSQGRHALVIEASDGIGGVWRHNAYPGARCDVESYDYSYSFSPELEQEWRWSERYATQPEILRYIEHVADRFGLRDGILLRTRMASAVYDEAADRWTVSSEDGRSWSARHLMLCMGQLSAPKSPNYPGLADYRGEVLHSGDWPNKPVSYAGKRVGIIGTGSSGMQMTPVIAQQADHLVVFQRTANFSIPAANAPVTEAEDHAVKAAYAARREQARNSPTGLGFKPNRVSALDASAQDREAVYEAAWNRLGFGFALAYYDILLSRAANDTAVDFIRRKIASKIDDPVLREKLMPKGHPFASRRPSVDSGYFEAFNRPNVELADIREAPIQRFTPSGIETAAKHHDLDMVILATGFDVFTGSLLKPRIVGRRGVTLRDKWADGPTSHLGVAVAGFPNMLIVCGPGSPSLLSNVLLSTEEQIDWFSRLLRHLDDKGIHAFEVGVEAERTWAEHIAERVRETLYMTTDSYYNGAEVSGKPRVFMPYSGGVRGYRRLLERCEAEGYTGFDFSGGGSAAKAARPALASHG
ncbi:MAG: NAD(P)/FAD-dependent oxidoreductase [Hyphomicrobiales bacterium]|nr:NAD(P)/FAD-dependent oxidoreductase [Hyphomicrobiales bacterium]